MSNPKLSLTEEEIEEELVNNDLLNSRGVKNEAVLNEMSIHEKKVLLRGFNKSKEFYNETNSSLVSSSTLDSSPSNFSLVPIIEKSNSEKRLKLPRKQLPTPQLTDSKEKCSDVVNRKFNLPNCIDDGALPLPFPDKLKGHGNFYCVMKGESPENALRRMLADHDKWKAVYTAETKERELQALGKDIEESQVISRNQVTNEDVENDPYQFHVKSPIQDNKGYSGLRKRETNITSSEPITHRQKSWTPQRKGSTDSDCEEVTLTSKPADTTMGDFLQNPRQKSKRNRKHSNNQEKGRLKSVDETTEVEFDFENKWEGQTSRWQGTQPSSLNNQIQTRRSTPTTPQVEEQLVECPICQKRFPTSKIETHAATCEGYSDSPMEVEEN